LKQQKAKLLNERIKQVTTEQPDITDRAIARLGESPVVKQLIEKKERTLKRTLEVEDYRKDETLREFVKGKIIELAGDRFADISPEVD